MGKSKDTTALSPPMHLEQLLWQLGYARVGGVDEVGLGPLAGPVVAAVVVVTSGAERLPVRDSKRLSAKQREALEPAIRESAADVALGVVDVAEVDELGVHNAGVEAMRRAVAGLTPPADYLLLDARTVPGTDIPQSAFVKADATVYSVAAASIVAKVHRDGIMGRLDREFPGYGLGAHMGYGTSAHLEALRRLGPSPIHRRSFAPVRDLCSTGQGEETG